MIDSDRRMPRLARAAAAACLALLAIGVPTAVHADDTACADIRFATGGYELFDLETRYVPPPLRGFDHDCASRLASLGEEDGPKA